MALVNLMNVVFLGLSRALFLLKNHRDHEMRLVWYAVAAIILFALAATALLGAIIWCSSKGMSFGAVRQKDPYTYWVGCF